MARRRELARVVENPFNGIERLEKLERVEAVRIRNPFNGIERRENPGEADAGRGGESIQWN